MCQGWLGAWGFGANSNLSVFLNALTKLGPPETGEIQAGSFGDTKNALQAVMKDGSGPSESHRT